MNKGGYGMGIDRLRGFLTWGESRATGVFRFFGQGGKAAIGYLGKRFKVTSFPKEGDRAYIIEENDDWTQRIDGQLKTYTVKEDRTITFDSGTVQIEIFGLTRTPNIKKMRHLLQATYGKLIESGELKILFNDKWLSPEVIEYEKSYLFSENTPYGLLEGCVGLSENGFSGGIRCYSQNRLITSRELFGINPTEYDLTKLTGEVFCDFVPVMPNKISYDTSGKEWYAVEAIIKEKARPLLEELKGITEIPPSLERITKELNEFINKALREADLDFESQGRKSPFDVSSIKIEFEKKTEQITLGTPEPKTPPELEDKGETSRLGFLEVHPKRMRTENIRCRIVDKTAELNIDYPWAKTLWIVVPNRRGAYFMYALESVALEYYKDKVSTPMELVDKVNNLLSIQVEKLNK